jgi:Zn-dependent metalloprotease
MVFGDGDHIAFDYLTDSLDVIGHELSHGFVQYSCKCTSVKCLRNT